MDWLVWLGAAVALAGVGGILYCIATVLHARRGGLAEDALRARLQRAGVVNAGALAVSAMGLIVVVVGILLT